MKHDYAFGIIPMSRDGAEVRLLLIQKNEGHWGFPKGHVEGAEAPLQTARRELLEETGIADCDIDEQTPFEENYDVILHGEKVPKTVVYYPAWVTSKQVTIQLIELKDFGWFSYDEALAIATYGVTKELLKSFKPYLESRT